MFKGITSSYAESVTSVLEDFGEKRPTIILAVPRVCEKVYQKILMQVEQQPPWRQKVFHWGAVRRRPDLHPAGRKKTGAGDSQAEIQAGLRPDLQTASPGPGWTGAVDDRLGCAHRPENHSFLQRGRDPGGGRLRHDGMLCPGHHEQPGRLPDRHGGQTPAGRRDQTGRRR